MKRIVTVFYVLLLMAGFAACSNDDETQYSYLVNTSTDYTY